MSLKICYLPCHSILEHDQLSLWNELGINVFSLGAYIVPDKPSDNKRPPLPQVAYRPELHALTGYLDLFTRLPDGLIDWADVILADGNPLEWLCGQWDRIKHKRVIWRTIGQSNPLQEQAVRPFFEQGLEIVRYSPAEKRYFAPCGWAGETALIRFHKDPADWGGWTGDVACVGNVSQHNEIPHERDYFIHWKFWEQATEGLPRSFAGLHSEKIGGLGLLDYDVMREYLRRARAYLFMGTVPASYTLGFIEAMLTGVPLVSVGKHWQWAGADLFEADEIALWAYDDPYEAHKKLTELLHEPDTEASRLQVETALGLFGKERIKEQWKQFLS